jgi:hypothetical protein
MFARLILVPAGMLVLGLVPAAPAAAQAPAPGTCWPFTDRQWDRANLPNVGAVDCASSHTAEAMGSVRVTPKAGRMGERAFWAWAFRKCHTVGITYVWGNESAPLPVSSYARPMSAQLATYIPTRAQRRAGERWVSCVGFNTTPTGQATARTGSIAFSGLEPHFCVSGNTWRWQACSAPDSKVMTNVVWLKKSYGAKYPGTRKAVKLAKKKCSALAGRTRTARTWYVPGKSAWNYGDHFGYCWIEEKTSL